MDQNNRPGTGHQIPNRYHGKSINNPIIIAKYKIKTSGGNVSNSYSNLQIGGGQLATPGIVAVDIEKCVVVPLFGHRNVPVLAIHQGMVINSWRAGTVQVGCRSRGEQSHSVI